MAYGLFYAVSIGNAQRTDPSNVTYGTSTSASDFQFEVDTTNGPTVQMAIQALDLIRGFLTQQSALTGSGVLPETPSGV